MDALKISQNYRWCRYLLCKLLNNCSTLLAAPEISTRKELMKWFVYSSRLCSSSDFLSFSSISSSKWNFLPSPPRAHFSQIPNSSCVPLSSCLSNLQLPTTIYMKFKILLVGFDFLMCFDALKSFQVEWMLSVLENSLQLIRFLISTTLEIFREVFHFLFDMNRLLEKCKFQVHTINLSMSLQFLIYKTTKKI